MTKYYYSFECDSEAELAELLEGGELRWISYTTSPIHYFVEGLVVGVKMESFQTPEAFKAILKRLSSKLGERHRAMHTLEYSTALPPW